MSLRAPARAGGALRDVALHSNDSLAGLAVLMIGWLQYCFFDAMVQTNRFPRVAVFAPLGVH